jgi:hypothetical protein
VVVILLLLEPSLVFCCRFCKPLSGRNSEETTTRLPCMARNDPTEQLHRAFTLFIVYFVIFLLSWSCTCISFFPMLANCVAIQDAG